MVKHHLMPSYYFNERFYIVYNINLIMFYDLLIFIFMSYIKPQPMLRLAHRATVVYRTIPTSNHNPSESKARSFSLYIVLFLHQTTTDKPFSTRFLRCISYYSYIKPQHKRDVHYIVGVVYRTIPTSNHNSYKVWAFRFCVVYRTIPTSNHNAQVSKSIVMSVVYRTIPTSNHNTTCGLKRHSRVVYRTIPTSNHNWCRYVIG